MFLVSVFYESASFRFFTWLQFVETALSLWFVKGWQISGVQMASMVIVLFEVITFKATISTFLDLEFLFPKVLINKRSLINVGKFNSFLNFPNM